MTTVVAQGSNNEDVLYRCPKCGSGKVFSALKELRVHLEMEHAYSHDSFSLSNYRGSPVLHSFNMEADELEKQLRLAKETEKRHKHDLVYLSTYKPEIITKSRKNTYRDFGLHIEKDISQTINKAKGQIEKLRFSSDKVSEEQQNIIKTLQEQLNFKEEQVKRANNELGRLANDRLNLQRQIIETEKQNDRNVEKLRKLATELEEKETIEYDRQRLKSEVIELEDENKKLNLLKKEIHEKDNLIRDSERLKLKISDLEEENAKLEELKEELKVKDIAVRDRERLKLKISDLEQENAKLEELKEELKAKDIAVRDRERDIVKLCDMVNSAKDKEKDAREKLEDYIQSLIDRATDAETELEMTHRKSHFASSPLNTLSSLPVFPESIVERQITSPNQFPTMHDTPTFHQCMMHQNQLNSSSCCGHNHCNSCPGQSFSNPSCSHQVPHTLENTRSPTRLHTIDPLITNPSGYEGRKTSNINQFHATQGVPEQMDNSFESKVDQKITPFLQTTACSPSIKDAFNSGEKHYPSSFQQPPRKSENTGVSSRQSSPLEPSTTGVQNGFNLSQHSTATIDHSEQHSQLKAQRERVHSAMNVDKSQQQHSQPLRSTVKEDMTVSCKHGHPSQQVAKLQSMEPHEGLYSPGEVVMSKHKQHAEQHQPSSHKDKDMKTRAISEPRSRIRRADSGLGESHAGTPTFDPVNQRVDENLRCDDNGIIWSEEETEPIYHSDISDLTDDNGILWDDVQHSANATKHRQQRFTPENNTVQTWSKGDLLKYSNHDQTRHKTGSKTGKSKGRKLPYPDPYRNIHLHAERKADTLFDEHRAAEAPFGVEDKRQYENALFCAFMYLSCRTLRKVSVVSKTWLRVARHPALWRRITLQSMRISSKSLKHLSKWCTEVASLTLEGIRPRPRHYEESVQQYFDATRGVLEVGLEHLLKANSSTLHSLRIVDCGNILTDRCVWLAGCHSRNLVRMAYISDTDPVGCDSLWSIAAGCRMLDTLIIPPTFPNDKPRRFNDECVEKIGQCWPQLKVLCIGGVEVTQKGLICAAKCCKRLELLELDHMCEVTEHVAISMCKVGLRYLQSLNFSFTPVTPKALLKFYECCPVLKSITVHVGISDYFQNTKNPHHISVYRDTVSKLKSLRRKAGIGDIIHIRTDYG